MSLGNLIRRGVQRASRFVLPFNLFYIPSTGLYVFKVLSGVPSGTPEAYLAVNVLTPDATHFVYGNVNGTWTALTWS